MWDLRTCQAQARMDVPGQPFGAMDEEGLVFAVACSSGLVSMFDARSYAAGPFLSFPLPLQQHGLHEVVPISCMKFSTNQQHLMVVVEGKIFIMDTFDGREVVSWDTGITAGGPLMEASFSADGEYAISGVTRAMLLTLAKLQGLVGIACLTSRAQGTPSRCRHLVPSRIRALTMVSLTLV
jgi:hypothetical protein